MRTPRMKGAKTVKQEPEWRRLRLTEGGPEIPYRWLPKRSRCLRAQIRPGESLLVTGPARSAEATVAAFLRDNWARIERLQRQAELRASRQAAVKAGQQRCFLGLPLASEQPAERVARLLMLYLFGNVLRYFLDLGLPWSNELEVGPGRQQGLAAGLTLCVVPADKASWSLLLLHLAPELGKLELRTETGEVLGLLGILERLDAALAELRPEADLSSLGILVGLEKRRQLRLCFRKMKTRWGSCHPVSGRICLNHELIHQPPAVILQVMVHELCHLFYANHGPRFYALLSYLCPNYERLRAGLNQIPMVDL